jgi:hypothetical protein
MTSEEKAEIKDEEIEEGEIDFSALSDKEKDDFILDMQAEEMIQRKQQLKEKVTDALPPKTRVKKRRRKDRPPSAAKLHPGFGRVVIRMGTAMAFSFAFILVGPILFFMAIIGRVGEKMWVNAIFGIIGVLLTISAWFLFRYIIKD